MAQCAKERGFVRVMVNGREFFARPTSGLGSNRLFGRYTLDGSDREIYSERTIFRTEEDRHYLMGYTWQRVVQPQQAVACFDEPPRSFKPATI